MNAFSANAFEAALKKACKNAWLYLGKAPRNESDFKHELYHQLAKLKIDNTKLNEKVPGTSSCRLHAETKIEPGRNLAKADLAICDPTQHMAFNYDVMYVLVLKHRLNNTGVKTEMEKLAKYVKSNRHFSLISAMPCDQSLVDLVEKLSPDEAGVHVYAPSPLLYQTAHSHDTIEEVDWKEVHKIVQANIEKVLELYGRGRTQYHGFYWCNYEQEQKKGQTYPCESDLTCQLYHRLRGALPKNTRILTEFKPAGTNKRIDLVVTDGTTALPIEVKMNWDQFEYKRVNGVMQEREASTILSRFALLEDDFQSVKHPKIIIIQYDLRQRSNRREEAISIFAKSPKLVELIAYSEESDKIVRKQLRMK